MPLRLLLPALLIIVGAVLVLRPSSSDAQSNLDSFVILVDVSGSMGSSSSSDPSKSKLEVAQDALTDAVGNIAPGQINLGLRAFSGCSASASTLVAPVAPADPAVIINEISNLNAAGGTGIETALRDAVGDFPVSTGSKVILLVSDGAETCGGDPCGAMADLVASGVDVVVNTIGFQTAGSSAEPQLECIATATGGTAVSVVDGSTLFDEVTNVIQTCTTAKLECYAPEIRFHPNESYYPMDPTDFVLGSELRWAANAGCSNPKIAGEDELTAASLNNHSWYEVSNVLCRLNRDQGRVFSTEYTRPTFKDPEPAPNGAPRAVKDNGDTLSTAEGFYIKSVSPDKPVGRAPVANVVDAPAYVVDRGGQVEYWFFYGYDPKSDFDPLNPPNGYGTSALAAVDGALAHQGDWERIIVDFDTNDTPTTVTYYGHGCIPFVVAWDQVEKSNGTHPIVYPAEGSHASYPMQREAGPPWDAEPGCGMGLSGRTDSARYTAGASAIWQTWNGLGLVNPATQAWYGFGGAWGNTGSVPFARGDGTGPAGLPYQGTGTALVQPAPGPAGVLDVADQIDFVWLEEGRFSFLDGLPGINFVVVLETVPQVVGRGQYDASGNAAGSFIVPESTAPGLHKIVIRNEATGEVLGSYPIWVGIAPECVPAGPADDVDGDGVANTCDTRPTDGPLADFDGDGVANDPDNCPTVSNPGQATEPGRSVGVACNSAAGVNPVPSYQVLITSAAIVPGVEYCPGTTVPVDDAASNGGCPTPKEHCPDSTTPVDDALPNGGCPIPTPEPTAVPTATVAPTAVPAAATPNIELVDPYTCGGAITGRVSSGSGNYLIEVTLTDTRGRSVTFAPVVAGDGTYAVPPTDLVRLPAGDYTVTVTATDATTQATTSLAYAIGLQHTNCAPVGGVVPPPPTAVPSPTVVAATPVPATPVPAPPAASEPTAIPILAAPSPAPTAPASVAAAPVAVGVAAIVGTTSQSPVTSPSSLPQITVPTTSTVPSTKVPSLAITGRESLATTQWGLLMIAIGALAISAPQQRRRPGKR